VSPYLDFVIRFGIEKSSVLVPLALRVLDLGVSVYAEVDGERRDLSDLLHGAPDTHPEIREMLESTERDKGGSLVVVFAEHDIFRLRYDLEGRNDVHLEFMAGKASDFFTQLGKEITEFRSRFLDNFTEEDLHEMIDISADFLIDVEDFSYRIIAEDTAFVEAILDEADINVQLLDLVVYLKTALFMLKGSDFFKVRLTSPMDLLKLLDSVQGMIRQLSTTYELTGLRVNGGIFGQTVFSAGRGVRPNITSRFGPTNIKLDSLFKILSETASKLKL
jgi:hypothetical protein